VLEIHAGTGGDEAALFAAELLANVIAFFRDPRDPDDEDRHSAVTAPLKPTPKANDAAIALPSQTTTLGPATTVPGITDYSERSARMGSTRVARNAGM
jgi:hypothetical protein